MKYLNSIFAFLILASSTAFSQAGSAGFQILRLGYSARDLSLANSADAITKEPIAVFINPAGLASDESENGIGLDFMLTHRTYIAGTTIDLFGTRFESGGISFGTSLLLSSVPDIEVRTVPGDPQATFSAKDFVFAAGVARKFDKMDIGVSATYLYEKLFVYESQGFAFNGGVKYSPAQNIELGLSAGNFGSTTAMLSQTIALPIFLRVGGSYTKTLDDNFSVTGFLGAATYKSGGITPSVGAEFNYQNILKLRAGYASGSDITGFSFGAGVNYNFLRFDYSYVPMKLDFGNSQTFTLSFIL
ncbi:MAG: PorV/PorQ family protein [Bacteroidetes bacterium]|nr:PorV/PorQ family protein [Bacteroidota bacterium]MCL5738990.1 PorV/PorQ family protein [Bacteroidota bacterium]